MAIRITFHGAAGGVTGSAYEVETGRARVLVDFGVFQGGAEKEALNRVPAANCSSRSTRTFVSAMAAISLWRYTALGKC